VAIPAGEAHSSGLSRIDVGAPFSLTSGPSEVPPERSTQDWSARRGVDGSPQASLGVEGRAIGPALSYAVTYSGVAPP
jgi:hypothetical protein